jgi:hypothetical protein
LTLKERLSVLSGCTQHGIVQNIVQPALVATTLAFEPFQHVGIYPHDTLLFDEPLKLAALCALPVFALRGRQV